MAAGFHGVFPYVVSPVLDSGEVDAKVLTRLCDDLVNAVGAPLAPQAPLTPEGIEEVRRALAAIGALP